MSPWTTAAPTTGYAVGGYHPTLVVADSPLTTEAVQHWLEGVPDLVPFLGCWRDSLTGLLHFDVVNIVPQKYEAFYEAARLNQLAIYDLAEAADIRLPQGVTK